MPTIITQTHIKQWLGNQSAPTTFSVGADCVLTKSALNCLQAHNITIKQPAAYEKKQKYSLEQPDIEHFHYLLSNQTSDQKNNYWTHLRGNQLIEKSHPLIRWRGSVDSLLAKVLLVSHDLTHTEIQPMLLEIARVLRAMLYADTTAQPLENLKLWGYTLEEVQEISHHPLTFFGIDHFFVSQHMGRDMLELNLLRTQARELELHALAAFPHGERLDLLEACNRLSSAFYLLMLKLKTLV